MKKGAKVEFEYWGVKNGLKGIGTYLGFNGKFHVVKHSNVYYLIGNQ